LWLEGQAARAGGLLTRAVVVPPRRSPVTAAPCASHAGGTVVPVMGTLGTWVISNGHPKGWPLLF
jgi:hypothetical protein